MANLLLLRFDEVETAVRPVDALGNLDDLVTEAGLVMPTVVDAAFGRGRRFVAATGHGLRAQDLVAGSTLLTRDATIQVALNWQIAAQNTYGSPGTVLSRGKGTAAAEYVSAALELAIYDAPAGIGEMRWLWQDLAGVDHVQSGGLFEAHPTEYLLLTATRRWVSSSEVVIRYYYADQLLAEVVSSDGSIGGGTTGTTSLGARYSGGAWGSFFDGTIDELRVVDHEMTLEEIRATWDRITYHQPRGYQLVREMHDPGFPISQDPASRVQRETRMWGHGLGFAVAQAENLRNTLPHRAYGEALEEWEDIVKESPKPGDSVDRRRARVVAREQQDKGVSIPGIGEALEELLAVDPADLVITGFTHDTVDDYAAAGSALNPLRWYYEPPAAWTNASNALRVVDDGLAGIQLTSTARRWKTARMSIGGNGRDARILGKIATTTLDDTAEVGFWFGDRGIGNLLLFGIRSIAGVRTLVSERFKRWASQGLVVHGTTTSAPHWLQLRRSDDDIFSVSTEDAPFRLEWSTTGPSGPWITSDTTVGPLVFHWAGLYARSDDAITGPEIDAAFDDVRTRAPWGDRALRFYVYRDPLLAGDPDILGANNVLQALKQAHTEGAVITEPIALYGDPEAGFGGSPMGGF